MDATAADRPNPTADEERPAVPSTADLDRLCAKQVALIEETQDTALLFAKACDADMDPEPLASAIEAAHTTVESLVQLRGLSFNPSEIYRAGYEQALQDASEDASEEREERPEAAAKS